ncbi:menaquinone biosynthesis family protein [Aureliella helgolandensis]|uniref:1,4-dihydroxy-6-naphtoate synthase n=1 Tax=Aureliella helgolandensis TaxID=2527968 RepID=A0A518GGX3_9BACT|nr:1,4-dihydroxy-6-naphthoate synthase [Aureliella helgolandensis]QDV27827.1 1,4-dihydroxy-6-naphtoate synthase [Aureliella helgolandensis]
MTRSVSSPPPIRLGISTCPNDTFTFHALLNRLVDWKGLDFHIELLDIQQLNRRLFEGSFDVAKASFHAALLLSQKFQVLPSGSALGFGVGPLLLAAHPDSTPEQKEQLTLCPGEHTTAALLFRLFYPQTTRIEHVVFSDIMPRLQRATADFGVCIHEGRFTWKQQGLSLVADLGTRWEAETECPLPLGGLLVSQELSPESASRVQEVVAASLQYSLENRSAALPTMRKYAQEFDDEVLMQHVDLYVNDWTVELGTIGQTALQALSDRARASGLIDSQQPPLSIFQPSI